jgi:hypothetical protein
VKLRGNSSTQFTPGRSFRESSSFDALLRQRHITTFDPTTPLAERMFLVNNAELVVTSYGATFSTLLFVLQSRRRDPQRALKMLILVHPDYGWEILPFKNKKNKRLPERTSYVAYGSISFALFRHDYDGGPKFCARFLYIHSLDSVMPTDFPPC